MKDRFFEKNPEFKPLADSLFHTEQAIIQCFNNGGKLLIGGNGGSHSDSLHFCAELGKSFLKKRELSIDEKDTFLDYPHGSLLSRELEKGLPAIALGCNTSLLTAILNDKHDGRFIFAQELMSISQMNDLFFAISTSGESDDLVMAHTVAKVKKLPTVVLTGMDGGTLGEVGDIVIQAPGDTKAEIQENHIKIYHGICDSIESYFFAY